MELTIFDEPTETKFLWSKLGSKDRHDFLENIFREEGIPSDKINKMIRNYNDIYIKSKQIETDTIYKYINTYSQYNELQDPGEYNKRQFVRDFASTLTKQIGSSNKVELSQITIPIVGDKKKYYNIEYIPKNYDKRFILSLSDNNEYRTISEPYVPMNDELLNEIIKDKFKIDVNQNPMNSIISGTDREVIRLGDLLQNKHISTLITHNIEINNEKPYDIPKYNNNNKFDTNIILSNYKLYRGDKLNISGFYLNYYLMYDDRISSYSQMPPFEYQHKINYLYNNQILTKISNELTTIINEYNQYSTYIIGEKSELLHSNNDNTLDYLYNVGINILNKIDNINEDAISQYKYSIENNKLIQTISEIIEITDNNNKLLCTIKKESINNIIGFFYRIFNNYHYKISNIITKILCDKFECKNKLSLKKILAKNQSDMIKKLLVIRNNHLKKLKEKTQLINYSWEVIQHRKQIFEQYEIDMWYIDQIFGRNVLNDIIKKSHINKKRLFDNLTTKQQQSLEEYKNNIKTIQENITAFWSNHPDEYALRVKYDISIDFDIKFKALQLLYTKYSTRKINKDKQYPHKNNPNIELLCEHELILLKLYDEYDEKIIDDLKATLEEFYSSASDNENEYFISCKYCARAISKGEYKMHDVFSKISEMWNVGYGKRSRSVLDKKIIKQIEIILDISKLVFKDRISFNITTENIFGSISDLVKNKINTTDYLTKDLNNPDLGRKINAIIAVRAFGKIIFEIDNSNGNIYPRGGKESHLEDKTKLLNYLIEWAIRQLYKLPYLAFTKEQLRSKDINNTIMSAYNVIRNRDYISKRYIIKTPIEYKFDEKFEEDIKSIDKFTTNKLYLEKILIYILNKFFVEQNVNITTEQINRLSIKTLKDFSYPQDKKDIIKYNINLNPSINDFWIKEYSLLDNVKKIYGILNHDFNKYVRIKKVYYLPRRIRDIRNRLNADNKVKYNEVISYFNKKGNMDLYNAIIDYFKLRCIDNTSHSFIETKNICINCGQTLEDIEHPSPQYFKYMKDAYDNIIKKKKNQIIQIHAIPSLPLIHVDKELINQYIKYDINGAINKIALFINQNKQIIDTDLLSKDIKIFNKTNNNNILIDRLSNLGYYEHRYNENIYNKTGISKSIYNKYRIDELIKYIKMLIEYYSILKYNKHIDLIKNYSNVHKLIKYIENGIILNYEINFNLNSLSNIATASNINSSIKIKILLSIIIEIITDILFKNPDMKTIHNKNNKQLLSTLILELIDLFIYLQNKNDTTEKDLNKQELIYDWFKYEKQTRFLNMTMEEKIETGILNLEFEQQEEVFIDEIFKKLNIESVQPESEIENYDEKSRKSVYDDISLNYNEFDFDYDENNDNFPGNDRDD